MNGSTEPLDATEWADVCVGIVACYPGHKGRIGVADFDAWHSRIRDLPGDLVLEACDRVTRDSRFPPSIADLLAAVDTIRTERRRNVYDLERQRAERADREAPARSHGRDTCLASYIARGCPGDPAIDMRTGEERVALIARLMGRGVIGGTATLRGDHPEAVEARRRLAPYIDAADLERLANTDRRDDVTIDLRLARTGTA